MTQIKRTRWYWKTDDGYKPVRLSEFRHSPIIKLLTETYCLMDGQYVRCTDIDNEQKRERVLTELRHAMRLLK